MFDKLLRSLNHKRFGTIAITAVAISFLLAGFGMASTFHWTGFPAVKNVESPAQITQSAPSAMPASFSDLAAKLSPTVVNIKMTKVEKVGGFPWPQIPEGPFAGSYDWSATRTKE